MSTHPTLRDELANRRAKKRELDRRAQRAARERNRDRIAALEATVDALKQQKSNSVVAGLMEQLNAVTKERNDLAKTLSLIETTLQVHRSGEKTKTSADPQSSSSSGRHDWPPDQPVGGVVMTEDTQAAELAENSQHPDISMPLTSPESWEITALDPSVMAPTHGLLDGLLALDPFTPGGHGAFDITHLDHDRVIVPSPKHMCDCALPHDIHRDYSPSTPRSIWRMANEVLGSRQSVCEDTLRREGMESEDLAVRIVLKGWDEVEASCELTPFWKQLRRIDELQFRTCGPTERPSQALPHSSAIDFFVWPGVRERFVFSQHQYCSNHFWKVFAENFRIAWPFEFRDCYKRNIHSGQYYVSPEFESRIGDINSWTMTTDFFLHFPDLCSDIPVYMSVPRSLELDIHDPVHSDHAQPALLM
ncbi:uncharacterized protein E0L32_007626 [Thyridium curvatum]|uniref:BZIP transcription factor n=1 Tax=Thyridium curvatum TaxID=1093900 RepID=A0A507AVZ8_9PEZI|nr:uncharacterized protein E0L32_007626 [Thyridium curvatum]TPX11647.1 hypothetical protein E0L32_007626 [Thyridium curvatum]